MAIIVLLVAGGVFIGFVRHPRRPDSSTLQIPGPVVPPADQVSVEVPRAPEAIAPSGIKRCGNADLRTDNSGSDLPQSAYLAADDTLAVLAKRLAAEASPRARGLALYANALRQSRAWWAYDAAHPGCSDDEACRAERDLAGAQESRERWDAFLEFAASTVAPDLYALAFYGCGAGFHQDSEGRCMQISAERWAQVDPDNAVPWLYMANAAERRGDLATRNEAYFRASRAALSNSRVAAYADLLQSDVTRSAPLETQVAMSVEFIGRVAAIPLPSSGLLQDFCSVRAVSDPNRRQVCSDLAEVMAERGDSLIDLSFGSTIARRVGWSPDRLDALRDRLDASKQLFGEQASSSPMEGCKALLSYVFDKVRFGEVVQYRRLIEASGRSTAQLAEQWRSSHPPRPQP